MIPTDDLQRNCSVVVLLQISVGAYLRDKYSPEEIQPSTKVYWNVLKTAAKHLNLSRLMTKSTKWHVRPMKTQISLGIRPVWSESSLSARTKLDSLATHWAHSEDSDQTGRMPRLIWVFAGRICHFVGFVTMRLISLGMVQLLVHAYCFRMFSLTRCRLSEFMNFI